MVLIWISAAEQHSHGSGETLLKITIYNNDISLKTGQLRELSIIQRSPSDSTYGTNTLI